MNPPIVEIRELSKTFSRWGQTHTALDHINLTISKGQWVMLIGHNGSGKSTLLNVISGRQISNGGQIVIAGKQTSKMSASEISEKVFHVCQDPLLGTAPKLTLFENLLIADYKALIDGDSKRGLIQKYLTLLQPLGLANRMKQLARDLSGGERQLIALLIAGLRPSSVVLLDEPLAALDPGKAQLCLQQIKILNDTGRTIIQVTHDPNLASSCGDRTIVLQKGAIVSDQSGDSRNVTELSKVWS